MILVLCTASRCDKLNDVDFVKEVVKDNYSLRDEEPPYTSNHTPAKSERSVPSNTGISVYINDDKSGVDPNSIIFKVNGEVINANITGSPNQFIITYHPSTEFEYNETIYIEIVAQDFVGNRMQTERYNILQE